MGADSLFIHTHGTSLPAIAVEWYSTKYSDVANNASKAYSVFAPSDVAMNNFFDNYWEKGGYESLDDVDDLAMKYMLNQLFIKMELHSLMKLRVEKLRICMTWSLTSILLR